MFKILMYEKLKENITKSDFNEVLELSYKIRDWIMKGNKNKIIQLDNSKILQRVHLSGKNKRMIFTFKDDVLKIYDIFTVTEEKEKLRYYDNICKNEGEYKNFVNITPKEESNLTEEINFLKEILTALESSALKGIPEKGKFNFDKLAAKIEKQKWIRKYPELKKLYYNLRHDINGDLKLNVLLKRSRKREFREKMIKNLLKLSKSALVREINARFENKPMVKASIQLRRMR